MDYTKTILNFAKKMAEDGLLINGRGSVSVKIDKTSMLLIKSTDYGRLDENTAVRYSFEDMDETGAMHAAIYQGRPEIEAILHFHSFYVGAAADKGVPVPSVLDDFAQIVGPSVKLVKDSPVKAMKGRFGCLIKGDGGIAVGRSAEETSIAAKVMEKGAKCFVQAGVLGGVKPIAALEAKLMHFVFRTKYSKIEESKNKPSKAKSAKEKPVKAKPAKKGGLILSSPIAEEAGLRQAVKDAGIRLLQQNLVQGTWGNISVRLNESKMLVTPSGLDYIRLRPEEMVVVDIETLEYAGNLKPTSESKLHAGILRERPEVNAVIHSHPTYCCVFAAMRAELDAMNEEMRVRVGENCRSADYALPGTKKMTVETMEALADRRACFMANHGVAAVGADLDEAFEVIRVLEAACKEYIESFAVKATNAAEYSDALMRDLYLKV